MRRYRSWCGASLGAGQGGFIAKFGALAAWARCYLDAGGLKAIKAAIIHHHAEYSDKLTRRFLHKLRLSNGREVVIELGVFPAVRSVVGPVGRRLHRL